MSERMVLVRHGDGPEDDRVVQWVRNNGLIADTRRPFQGDMLGDVTDDVLGTVIYGGMYNAYDTEKHPFLNEEYRWIGAALEAGIPVLGICQGAQMIAWHLGAWAGAPEHGSHEFGFYPVTAIEGTEWFLPNPLHFTQAHFHTFDLPEGAEHLARSALFENQAFRIGQRVYGLQFHAECGYDAFRRWQKGNTSYGQPGAQTQEEQDTLGPQIDAAQHAWFMAFMDRLFGAVV